MHKFLDILLRHVTVETLFCFFFAVLPVVMPKRKAKDISNPVQIFFSRSKEEDTIRCGNPNWRAYLSNFAPCMIKVDDRTYPSVEHAFQGLKASFSSKPWISEMFSVGGSVGASPLDAKKKGSKKGFESEKAVLNTKKWLINRDYVMMKALLARYCADAEFRRILGCCKKKGVCLLHFERSGEKSYWGAHPQVGWMHCGE